MASPENFLTKCFDRDNPPTLDRKGRAGTLSLRDAQALADTFGSRFRGVRGAAARGLLLLWHDHWEEAHRIAQSDEGEPHHDLMHAIAHRREVDYSNSGYWFREAGAHDAFTLLGERAQNLLIHSDDSLKESLLPKGKWNTKAFLDAVRLKTGGEPLLRALQAEEIISLFESWTA